MRCLFVPLTLLLVACSVRPVADPPETNKSTVDLYRSFDGRSYIPCWVGSADDRYQCGEPLYARPYHPELETGFPSAADYWVDCSNQDYVCVMNLAHVLAAPRGRIAPGDRFDKNGASLVVEACYSRNTEQECSLALISSRVGAECGATELDTFSVKFFYTPSRGITEILSMRDGADFGTLIPSESWSLIDDQGFLTQRWTLPKVGEESLCD